MSVDLTGPAILRELECCFGSFVRRCFGLLVLAGGDILAESGRGGFRTRPR